MNKFRAGVCVLIAGLSCACASGPPYGNLTPTVDAELFLDFAPIPGNKPRELPFVTQEIHGISVSANLRQGHFLGNEVYWLRLIIRNENSREHVLSPEVVAHDGSGLRAEAYSFNAYQNYLASYGNARIPSVSSVPPTSAAPSSGGFAGGFAQGLERGTAMAANSAALRSLQMQRAATDFMYWGDQNWLKDHYIAFPGQGVSGILPFPAPRPLPLHIDVYVNGIAFSFESSSILTRD